MSPSVLPHHNNNTLAYDNMWRNEIYAILAGLLGGARYGVKIRLPHALVMTSLFRKDLTSRGKLRQILRMTLEHASHLAAFATIYKVSR
jgi:peroxisomal membrane protein 4